MKQVVVIGAGVIGLTTAVVLLESRRYKVTVIAKHLPSDISHDYTSIWAGANWFSFSTPDDLRLQGYESETLDTMLTILQQYSNTGIMSVQLQELFPHKPTDWTDPWFMHFCKNFRYLKGSELVNGSTFGFTHDSITISLFTYLNFLTERILTLGGHVIRGTLDHITDPFMDPCVDIVVNCTGNHARILGGVKDLACYPKRGQTVVVRTKTPLVKKTITQLFEDGSVTYVIPRENGNVVLGGTAEVWDEYPEERVETTEHILGTAVAMCPELGRVEDLEVEYVGVGFRPARLGGIRCEVEGHVLTGGRSVLIAHNYGHSSYGYQTSWGSAKELFRQLEHQARL